MHLHRVTRDVYADGSRHAVGFPRLDVAVGPARRHEAVFAAAMACALAAAIARNVAGDLGVFGGELIHRVNDFNRACGRSADEWQQRQVGLWMRSERHRPGWFGRCGDDGLRRR